MDGLTISKLFYHAAIIEKSQKKCGMSLNTFPLGIRPLIVRLSYESVSYRWCWDLTHESSLFISKPRPRVWQHQFHGHVFPLL